MTHGKRKIVKPAAPKRSTRPVAVSHRKKHKPAAAGRASSLLTKNQ